MLEVNILGSEPSVTTPCLTWISSVVPILQVPHRDGGFLLSVYAVGGQAGAA